MEWLRLCATNDTNGNPRRVYVGVEDGRMAAVADEGYRGRASAYDAGMPRNVSPFDIMVTPAEYKNTLTYGQYIKGEKS